MLKIARVSTVGFFVEMQLKQQIQDISNEGFEVTVVASDPKLASPIEGTAYKSIYIPREIDLVRDLFAIFKLVKFFKEKKFDIVHSTTPKGGLVSAIAAYVARVPVRIHTYTGQVWVEREGIVRFLAKQADWLIARLNTQCYADSPSQVQFLLKNQVAPEFKIKCLGSGSLAGVNLARFNSANYTEIDRSNLLAELNVPAGSKVLAFVGRCTRDKGLVELLKALQLVVRSGLKPVLLIVGFVEGDVMMQLEDLDDATKSCIRVVGYTKVPEKYLAISDVIVLPSYREGFGTVIIEAAAMGVPAIGTNIYGLKDAIIENETGCLVPAKKVPELADAISRLLMDDRFRECMGSAASNRAKKYFSHEYVNKLLVMEYRKLTARQGL